MIEILKGSEFIGFDLKGGVNLKVKFSFSSKKGG
jgi:hypothetical protein